MDYTNSYTQQKKKEEEENRTGKQIEFERTPRSVEEISKGQSTKDG